jgi:NodT family efflux transporter outer membrane factor (OMF) lipoprotein
MKLFIMATLGFLAGCTVGPNYQKPELSNTLPTQYQQVEGSALPGSAVTEHWWLIYHDPAINQLVDDALQRNLDLVSANANIVQARAQLNIADSANQPKLNANGRVGRDKFSQNSEDFANIPFPNPETNFSDYRVGFDASWEIDLFGHNQRSTEAAKARLTSMEFQRQEVELRIAAEVVHNVIDYRAYQQRSNNAQQIVDDAQKMLDLILLQKDAGLLANSDVLDAQTVLNSAKANLPPLQSAALGSLMAITVLVNQNQQQVTATLQSGAPVPAVPEQIDAIGLPSDLLLRRPDIQSAERELAAATADIGVAVADQYPQITLLASGGLDSISPGKLTNLASRYWDLGPQISIPLLSGGRLAAQVKGREAARDAALAQYRQTILAAFADTETALIRYQREQQRLKHIEAALHTQQQQLVFAEQHFQTGDTNYTAVLQAHTQLAQINDTKFASQQALAENLAALYKALGGGTPQKNITKTP